MQYWKIWTQTARCWLTDPLFREQVALAQAKRKGMARMIEPLRRALSAAHPLDIQFHSSQMENYLQVLRTIAPLFEALSPVAIQVEPRPVISPLAAPSQTALLPTYVVSAVTLATAYTQLTRKLPGAGPEPEWMLAVTGVKHGDLRTLEQLVEVKLAHQSPVTAAFDMEEFARMALDMDEQGLALHAIMHSHRFAGPPQPSSVDWRLQDLLDQGGYPAIQAVFSEDGYVRFFARRPFTLTISGKGVHCVDPDTFLYQLTQHSSLSKSGASSRSRGATVDLRPL